MKKKIYLAIVSTMVLGLLSGCGKKEDVADANGTNIELASSEDADIAKEDDVTTESLTAGNGKEDITTEKDSSTEKDEATKNEQTTSNNQTSNNQTSNNQSNNNKPATETANNTSANGTHQHNYTIVSMQNGKDCKSFGTNTYQCSCGASYTEQSNLLGYHDWEDIVEEKVIHHDAEYKDILVDVCKGCGWEWTPDSPINLTEHQTLMGTKIVNAGTEEDPWWVDVSVCAGSYGRWIEWKVKDAWDEVVTTVTGKKCRICGEIK